VVREIIFNVAANSSLEMKEINAIPQRQFLLMVDILVVNIFLIMKIHVIKSISGAIVVRRRD